MSSTDRDKAAAVSNQWVIDDGVNLLANHHNDLDDRIATALAEVRRETWEAAIEIARIHFKHSGYTLHHKSEALGSELIDCRRAILFELEAESAKEKDVH